MSNERLPHVDLTIEWQSPSVATIVNHSINYDVARTRAGEVAKAAVMHALESADGNATVTIRVKRKAAKPYRPNENAATG